MTQITRAIAVFPRDIRFPMEMDDLWGTDEGRGPAKEICKIALSGLNKQSPDISYREFSGRFKLGKYLGRHMKSMGLELDREGKRHLIAEINNDMCAVVLPDDTGFTNDGTTEPAKDPGIYLPRDADVLVIHRSLQCVGSVALSFDAIQQAEGFTALST